MDKNKRIIINRFLESVKGKRFDPTGFNSKHCGAEGHWLELQMGITPNGSNEADLLGYEMKKETSTKTTFGDWAPNLSLWGRKRPYDEIEKIDRDTEFLKYFGQPNLKKDGRLSWSGKPSPKINAYNTFGQILTIDEDENILALYSFSKDQRSNKDELIPNVFKRDNLIIAKWEKESLKGKVERKFNDKGWFKCFKDPSGVYESIGFGDPFDYNDWIKLVKLGVAYYDSGMYAGNKRPYAMWRASNNHWDVLVEEKYSN